MKQRLARLDRIAGELNALLVVIAIGLGILDLTVLIGKGMSAAIAESMPVPAASAANPGAEPPLPSAAAPVVPR